MKICSFNEDGECLLKASHINVIQGKEGTLILPSSDKMIQLQILFLQKSNYEIKVKDEANELIMTSESQEALKAVKIHHFLYEPLNKTWIIL